MKRFDDVLTADRDYQIEIKKRDDELLKLKLNHREQKKVIDQGKPAPVLKPDGQIQFQNTTKDKQKLRENYQLLRKQVQKNSRQNVYKIAEKIGKNHPDYPRWLNKEQKKDRLRETSKENAKSMSLDKRRHRER